MGVFSVFRLSETVFLSGWVLDSGVDFTSDDSDFSDFLPERAAFRRAASAKAMARLASRSAFSSTTEEASAALRLLETGVSADAVTSAFSAFSFSSISSLLLGTSTWRRFLRSTIVVLGL